MPELETRELAVCKDSVQSRLKTLYAERGSAALDGRKFDNRPIQAAEVELAGLGDAEVVALHRRRVAARAARDAQRAEAQREIRSAEGRRLEAVAKAEVLCRELVAAIDEAKRAADLIRLNATAMERPAPLALMPHAVEARFSDRLMVLLGGVAARVGWFGHIALRRPFGYSAADDWSAIERRATAGELAALLDEPAPSVAASPASTGQAASDAIA